ncbi:MAG: hypothetical protein FWF16_05005 [Microbacteriaceae bacterium]|nr:hypothetical protein [Microbacteriaceae bacterium]
MRTSATTAQNAAKVAAEAARRATRDYSAARTHLDKHLSPDGNREANRRAAQGILAAASADAQSQRARNRAAVDYLTSAAAEVRPKIADTADALAVARGDWDNIRSRIDRGTSIPALLEGATLGEALAFEKWGPDLMASKTPAPGPALDRALQGTTDDRPDYSALITERLAALATPDVAEVLRAAQAAPRQVAAADPYLRIMHDIAHAPLTMLDAAIESALVISGSTSDESDEDSESDDNATGNTARAALGSALQDRHPANFMRDRSTGLHRELINAPKSEPTTDATSAPSL